jgi:excisionase family DNA binding protein
MQAASSEQFLTTSSAARELRVAEGTIRRMAERGELPVLRTAGGLRLFRRSDIERIAEARRRARE